MLTLRQLNTDQIGLINLSIGAGECVTVVGALGTVYYWALGAVMWGREVALRIGSVYSRGRTLSRAAIAFLELL